MPILVTVSDHAHGGGKIIIKQVIIIANSFDEAVDKAIVVMGDYPFVEF